jgi:hypothetical protein
MIARLFKRVAVSLATLTTVVGLNCNAASIYDNSTLDLGSRLDPGLNEVGDEIVLEGSERYLTDFAFGFWGLNNGVATGPFTGAPEVRVRFYLNDGPDFNGYATPGSTPFYDSDWFSLGSPTERDSWEFSIGGGDFPAGGLLMPVVSNFTWTVQFQGLGANDTAGLDIFGPPTVGSSYPDYWENVSGTWTLKTNVIPVNFAARFEAVVPEPSGVVLAILGGLGLVLFGRRCRKA